MSAFYQAVACVLIGVILCAVLSHQGKEITILLSLAVSCMVLMTAVYFLDPVVELMEELRITGQLDAGMMQTILKAVGIGLIAELAALICADAGNSALGRAVEILAAGAILWLSIPLMNTLLELVLEMAGGI